MYIMVRIIKKLTCYYPYLTVICTYQNERGTNTMMKKVTEKQAKALLEIAKNAAYAIEKRGDLEYRMSDSEDFIEVSVGSIETMLEQAFLLGKAAR